MIVEISPWQQFGPGLIALVTIFVLAAALFAVGRGAARAYEATARREATEYKRFGPERRRSRLVAFEDSRSTWLVKAKQARTAQAAAVAVGVIMGLAFVWFNLINFLSPGPGVVWVMTIIYLVAVVVLGIWLPLRGHRRHQESLAADTVLREEGGPVQ